MGMFQSSFEVDQPAAHLSTLLNVDSVASFLIYIFQRFWTTFTIVLVSVLRLMIQIGDWCVKTNKFLNEK